MAEVLSLQLPDGSPFSHSPLRASASHTSFFDSNSPYAPNKHSYSHTDLRSGSLSSSQSSSFQSTPSSSVSLETKFDTSSEDDDDDDDDDDEGLAFPTYYSTRSLLGGDDALDLPSSSIYPNRPPPSPVESAPPPELLVPTPDPLPMSEDDTAVRMEPSQHVDYLSHEWKEEDIWSSWRHIVEHRRVYGERSRLENASWRTWAKSQFNLKTVSPETLNWLKDCDVTWLYGPLQPASNRTYSQHTSEPTSRLSKNNSFINKKPILKKRSMSEAMLQRSLSASSLVKQAAAAVQAQQQGHGPTLERRRHRPIMRHTQSDFATSSISSRATSRDPTDCFSSRSTSGLHTPDHGERKHIRFDDKVEQCIAVDCKEADEEEDYNSNSWTTKDDDDSSDEGVIMMKRSRKKVPLPCSNSKSSFTGGEGKTIAKLPSTTLKYRTDSPDVTEQQPMHSLGFWRSSRLSPSLSQETLRPSNPSTNFLLPEEDEDEEEEEEHDSFLGGDLGLPRGTNHSQSFHVANRTSGTSRESAESGGLRRTPSGMFMPFNEEEDDDTQPPGIIGRVVDTVNTARDIAHVIWNVGWRS